MIRFLNPQINTTNLFGICGITRQLIHSVILTNQLETLFPFDSTNIQPCESYHQTKKHKTDWKKLNLVR